MLEMHVSNAGSTCVNIIHVRLSIITFFCLESKPSAITNIRNTSRDVECGSMNIVTFEWDPPTNIINISEISYYEIVIRNDTFNKTDYTVDSKLTDIISNGNYVINITAVNKCGERSVPVLSSFTIMNSCLSLSDNSNCQSMYEGWYATSITLIVVIIFLCLCCPLFWFIIIIKCCKSDDN